MDPNTSPNGLIDKLALYLYSLVAGRDRRWFRNVAPGHRGGRWSLPALHLAGFPPHVTPGL